MTLEEFRENMGAVLGDYAEEAWRLCGGRSEPKKGKKPKPVVGFGDD
jgi:hypothetical protein